jgi:hypothetical protein
MFDPVGNGGLNLRQLNATTWATTRGLHVGNKSQPVGIEIGDVEDTIFRPQLKLKRWNNESNISMRLTEAPTSSSLLGNRIVSVSPNYVSEFKNTRAGFDITLMVTSVISSVTFTLNKKNCTFVRQPVYTDSLGDQVSVMNGGETFFKDGVEDIMPFTRRCPLNNQGSYIVIHDSKRDGQYATGKICTLFRPTLTDDDGNESFVDITIANDQLTYDLTPFAAAGLPWTIE